MTKATREVEKPDPLIVGITAAAQKFEIASVKAQLFAQYDALEKLEHARRSQEIAFAKGPVCLTWIADAHVGSEGVDHRRLYRELEIVRDTPGMWLCSNGDLLDNMIIQKLYAARFNNVIAPEKEWALLRDILLLVAPKLLVTIDGNHENWNTALTGIDMFAEIVKQIQPRALYHPDDVRFVLKVGQADFPIRARHKWRYFSKYNLTHGIEDMCRFDGDFTIGIGAHTHSSGVCRGFNAQGRNGMAVLCGTYKRIDKYATKLGMPKPNASTAQSIIFFDDGSYFGVENLERAAWLMQTLGRRK